MIATRGNNESSNRTMFALCPQQSCEISSSNRVNWRRNSPRCFQKDQTKCSATVYLLEGVTNRQGASAATWQIVPSQCCQALLASLCQQPQSLLSPNLEIFFFREGGDGISKVQMSRNQVDVVYGKVLLSCNIRTALVQGFMGWEVLKGGIC